jgi:hypothetical protein
MLSLSSGSKAGRVQTNSDGLNSAISWAAQGSRLTGFFDADNRAVVDGTAITRSGSLDRLNDVNGPVLINWQLFDLVQRLPRNGDQSWSFTLVDQFELIKPSQRLSYRGAVETIVNGQTRKLHGYDLIGFGSLPSVYWVDDETSRMLAATAGLEAYVLGALPRGGGTERAPGKKKAAAGSY